jgi:hypothetical protein
MNGSGYIDKLNKFFFSSNLTSQEMYVQCEVSGMFSRTFDLTPVMSEFWRQ